MNMHNWSANLEYEAETIHFPGSVPAVQELVAELPKVRALGTRHCFSDIADSPRGGLVSLERLAPEIAVDEVRQTVSVTSGTRYGVLADELERRGLALQNLGSLPHISIGGATATGTHGSGDTNGVLSTSIAAIEAVGADGNLIRVDRSSPDLPALAVGLGAFGIFTRIELDVEPTYRVRQDVYRNASWDEVLESLDDVMAAAYSVSLLGDIGGPVLNTLLLKQRLDEGDGSAPNSMCGGVWWDDSDRPSDDSWNVRRGIPGPWSERMAHFRLDAVPSAGGDELQSEYFVDRAKGASALRALRSIADQISPHLRAMEIRTVASDRLWLSPAYDRAGLCLGFTWHKRPKEVGRLLPVIEAVLDPYQPRPHWGKLFANTDFGDRFPRLGDFLDLVRQYDPTRKFWNPFLERLGS